LSIFPELTSVGSSIGLILAAIAVLMLTVAFWYVYGLQFTCRVAGLLLFQLVALVAVGVGFNRQFVWFSSWSDFIGKTPPLSSSVAASGRLDEQLARVRQASSDVGFVLDWQVRRGRSRLSLPMKIYVPAAYFTAARHNASFPVIEFLAGFPGGPGTWLRALATAQLLDCEMAAWRMAPTVAIFPTQNVLPWQDSECVDAVEGPQLDTFLTTDVPVPSPCELRLAPPAVDGASLAIPRVASAR
jgi:hypothetical protein